MTPEVSLIIPTTGERASLAVALRTALAQDFPRLEIIVVDDAPPGATWTQVEPYATLLADPRVRVVPFGRRGGCAAANTWHGITPFIGAGVGGADVQISGFTDTGAANASVATGDDHDQWNFAWAVYAGLGFEVTDAFTVELAYRYLDLGDGESGDLIAFDGTNNVDNPMHFNDITSHDIKLGVRYTFW